MPTLYGIPNCDTVKKARAWLDAHGIACDFHDYKKAGIDAATLRRWSEAFGYLQVLNQRGTTWRSLDAAAKQGLDEAKAIALMQAQPSLIRRPILETDTGTLLGFREAEWRRLL